MTDTGCNKNDLSLLHLVPQVLRARDFRLYTKDGRRLIDLWQNGGAAVLGHTPPFVLREIKNTASRGLYAPLPHFSEQRFIKALAQILPGRSFRIYYAPPADRASPVIWRPFLDFCAPVVIKKPVAVQQSNGINASGPALVIPVLPGIQGWRDGLPFGICVYAALSGEGANSPAKEIFGNLPPGDFLPPVALAAATRGIWDLVAAAPERANIQYHRINKILKDSPWRRLAYPSMVSGQPAGRSNIYLAPRNALADSALAVGAWETIFRRFLDAGFLLPPVPGHPLILPGIMSPGEEAKLAMLLQEELPA